MSRDKSLKECEYCGTIAEELIKNDDNCMICEGCDFIEQLEE